MAHLTAMPRTSDCSRLYRDSVEVPSGPAATAIGVRECRVEANWVASEAAFIPTRAAFLTMPQGLRLARQGPRTRAGGFCADPAGSAPTG